LRQRLLYVLKQEHPPDGAVQERKYAVQPFHFLRNPPFISNIEAMAKEHFGLNFTELCAQLAPPPLREVA
jgi:hypothetical protein